MNSNPLATRLAFNARPIRTLAVVGFIAMMCGAVAMGADAPVGYEARLRWVSGSTKKLQQLLGDYDKQLKQPTRTQTLARFGIRGADLGSPFGHQNRTIFLFGDTVGSHPGDAVGFTQTDDPDKGVDLNFYTGGKGEYLPFKPDGRLLGGFELPLAGITIGDETFVAYKDHHTEGGSTDICHLARWDGAGKIATLRRISAQPEGKFIKLALHTCPEDTPSLPGRGPWILMWGAGKYRASDVYLAITPAASFATGAGTRYFSGFSGGQPLFATHEGSARAAAQNGTVGDVSVTYVRELKQWIMLYDSRSPRGIVFRHSAAPWGPFSDEQTIFTAKDGLGLFIHDPARNPPDGLAGPVIGAKNKQRPEAVQGGAYAPYAVQRWTKLNGNALTIYFLLSTWNPYTVVLMRSEFHVER